VIHCYLFIDAGHRYEVGDKVSLKLSSVFDQIEVEPDSLRVRVIRSVGPCRYQACADIVL